MSRTDLQGIAAAVLRRAQEQGFVVPREIRDELTRAGLAPTMWKEVLELIRSSLRYRQGRYHYSSAVATRMRSRLRQTHQQKQAIQRAVHKLIRRYKSGAIEIERREHQRIHFVQSVRVQTEDRREVCLLSRDISLLGIRLVGTCGLQGQKVRIWVPATACGTEACGFLVHILWSNPVGDGLVESGGAFLEMLPSAPEALKIVGEE